MKQPPIPADEDQRLCRLLTLGVLDTGSEGVLDSFTDLAASLTGHPIALICWTCAARTMPASTTTSSSR
jgi:hypothetical protein